MPLDFYPSLPLNKEAHDPQFLSSQDPFTKLLLCSKVLKKESSGVFDTEQVCRKYTI